jgi:O-antigen ligase
VLPKLFASTVGSFFNLNKLVASQYTSVGLAGQGRLADLHDVFAQFVVNPWAGTGVGSRVVVGANANAQILDNQWLSSLLESGVIGVLGMIVFLGWPVIKMVRFGFTSSAPDSRKFLVFAIAVSTVGYITAMFFYDAFAFMQTLLTLSILYALAAWAMTDSTEAWSNGSTEAAQSPSQVVSTV